MTILGINCMLFWSAVIFLCVIVEGLSLNLSSIWFAVGAVAALIAASFRLSVITQVILFVLFSILFLILVRPICKRLLKHPKEATNADRIIGEVAIVTESIDNRKEVGEIKIFGQRWTARTADNSFIENDAMVRITAIRGVKAIVERESDL